jgi:hypothetical protein
MDPYRPTPKIKQRTYLPKMSSQTAFSRRLQEGKSQLHKKLRHHEDPIPVMTANLTMAELGLNGAIQKLKQNKNPGKDGVCHEMINYLGLVARE